MTPPSEMVERVAREFAAALPPHKASLHLEHNPHLGYSQSVEQWDEDQEKRADWVSPEERAKAIATNEIWTLQWYPETPIGFHALVASSLEALIDAALKDSP